MYLFTYIKKNSKWSINDQIECDDKTNQTLDIIDVKNRGKVVMMIANDSNFKLKNIMHKQNENESYAIYHIDEYNKKHFDKHILIPKCLLKEPSRILYYEIV